VTVLDKGRTRDWQTCVLRAEPASGQKIADSEACQVKNHLQVLDASGKTVALVKMNVERGGIIFQRVGYFDDLEVGFVALGKLYAVETLTGQ
jgi:hypothetical protein